MAQPFLGNDKYNSALTAQWNFSPADTTMSVAAVPSNLPTIITAGFGTADETVFSVTGTSGGNTLTGVTRLRGANKDLPQGTVVEVLDNMEFWNQYASAIFNQSGLKSLLYGVDGGSNDTYAITLLVAPTSYADVTGVPILFKANTINTGAATLNINGLGAKTIKKNGSSDLSDGDIAAGQVVAVTYDGTNFQLLSSIAPTINTDGTFAANSDALIPSQKAVKTYVDAHTSASTAPSFRAHRGTTQPFSASTWTKVQFTTEDFDSNNNYDSVTDYRFIPTVAGKYLVTVYIDLTTGSDQSYLYAAVYKNGSVYSSYEKKLSGTLAQGVMITDVVSLDGSTDYIEGFTWTEVSTPVIGISSFIMAAKVG